MTKSFKVRGTDGNEYPKPLADDAPAAKCIEFCAADGRHRRHLKPHHPVDKGIYELEPAELKGIPSCLLRNKVLSCLFERKYDLRATPRESGLQENLTPDSPTLQGLDEARGQYINCRTPQNPGSS